MRIASTTLGCGALGGVGFAVVEGITWHNTCSASDVVQLLCSREENIVFAGVVGFLVGGLVGLVVWCLWEGLRLAREKRLAKERQTRGPGGEPNA